MNTETRPPEKSGGFFYALACLHRQRLSLRCGRFNLKLLANDSVKLLTIIFQVLLLASFAIWFGGFFFYVSFVVPIGNEVLGSSFEQGMITRRATVPLNWLGVLSAVLMIVDSILSWRIRGVWNRRVQLACPIIMLAMLASLFILHPQIDAFADRVLGEIKGDYDQFYWLHRLYLWASTVQWIAEWIWLIFFVSSGLRKEVSG